MVEFTDRYEALGIPYPDLDTVCKGQCEGTGVIPVYINSHQPDLTLQIAWKEMHDKYPHECDGWHFVICPTCKGKGKR
jgi:hypothetical protein